MRRAFILTAVVTLSACTLEIPDFRGTAGQPAVAEAAAPAVAPLSAKERFVSAAEANGCVLNAQNVATVMTEAQLSQGDLENIMLSLVAEGRAAPSDDSSFRITTANCAA